MGIAGWHWYVARGRQNSMIDIVAFGTSRQILAKVIINNVGYGLC